MNKLSIIAVFFVLSLGLILSGCAPKENSPPEVTLEGGVNGNTSNLTSSPIVGSADSEEKEDSSSTSSEEEKFEDVAYTITATEGDLVSLKLKAVDPDGSKVSFEYGKPFNDQGLWQTEDGDAGKYLVRVSASDSLSETDADVLVVINPRNKGPIVDCPEEISLKEGETVTIDCKFLDKENDPISVEYSGWMTGTTLTTNFESAGEHIVLVKATDGISTTTKTIEVNVQNVPRAPIFNANLKDLTATETDIVTLKVDVSTPDKGEEVELEFSEPFDRDGIWKTEVGDAGTYPVTVVATSQGLSTKQSFTLTLKMLNTAPVMKLIPNYSVEEGDIVEIDVDVVDREKDPIKVTFSGWMSDSSYTTTYDDAYPNGCAESGCKETYKVTVTATDGVYSVSQDVYVTVKDKNRPPVFIWP